jgi:transposase
MQVVYAACCGIDIHKRTAVACRITPGADGGWVREVRTFATMTADLLALADWLAAGGVTHVALESTGVYWQPVYNLLEGQFEVLVVNARHMKNVPGRKTDVKDAEWIAELLQHGLLRGSFVPSREQRDLRALTRYRATLVQERTRVVQRLHATLEDANLKLGSVASDVLGVSGRAMLRALIDGQTDAAVLADLAVGRLRAKRAELERALDGRIRPHHRFLLTEQLDHLDQLDGRIERVSTEITARLAPAADAVARLDTIPGVSQRLAEVIVAEVGTDLSRFPSAKHLASWAGMCPGNHESAGKRGPGTTRKGSKWLRWALVEAAKGAARTRGSYLQAQYQRLAARRGKKRAAVAVGHSILVSAYHLLTRGEDYRELGAAYFDERDRRAVERRLVARLERLGHRVILEPLPTLA